MSAGLIRKDSFSNAACFLNVVRHFWTGARAHAQDIEKAMELESSNPEFLFTAVSAGPPVVVVGVE